MKYIKFENFINSTQYGYTAETTSPISGDAKYLRITDIVPYFVEKDRVPYCAIDASKVNKYIVHDGDVLIARTGATTGYNLVVDDSFKNYVFASYLIRFNYDRKRLHPRYLKYVLKSPSWYGFVNNYIGGSAQPGMNARVFGKYYLPYTDFSTQQKIASILSAYDSLIENNKKRIKLLEQMAENLYKEWFVRFRFPGYETAEFEGEVPKGWLFEKLNDFGIILETGSRPKGGIDASVENGIPSLGAEAINGLAEFDYNNFKLVSLDYYNSMKRGKSKGDHILVYKDGAYIGKVTLFRNAFPFNTYSINEHVFFLNTKDVNYQNYLYFTLHQPVFFTMMQNLNRNAAQPGLSQQDMFGIKVFKPTINVVTAFNSFVEPILDEVFNLAKENRLLTTQRDLLLPRLMSSKLSI